MLIARALTIAVAESCTGGLIASRLTDVPGSSRYVERGVVTYSNASKIDLLGVPSDMIAAHGAVSEQVAITMAEGIRTRSGVDIGIGVTGIAGPQTAAHPTSRSGRFVLPPLLPRRNACPYPNSGL